MTKHKSFKKAVRARMKATGESYMTAAAVLNAEQDEKEFVREASSIALVESFKLVDDGVVDVSLRRLTGDGEDKIFGIRTDKPHVIRIFLDACYPELKERTLTEEEESIIWDEDGQIFRDVLLRGDLIVDNRRERVVDGKFSAVRFWHPKERVFLRDIKDTDEGKAVVAALGLERAQRIMQTEVQERAEIDREHDERARTRIADEPRPEVR